MACELPAWSDGAVAILSTTGDDGAAHAIPLSTCVRAGPRRVVFALARRRGSLARLRAQPRVALTLLAAGDVAVTAHGRAAVVSETLPGVSESVAAVALDVERIADHGGPHFEILAGVCWRWTDARAQERDAAVRAALSALAAPPTP